MPTGPKNRLVKNGSQPNPVRREELEARRGGVVCPGPSGTIYRVRSLNLTRHMMSGGLPPELLAVAQQASRGLDRAVAESTSPEMLAAMREYSDRLVLAVIVEPSLTLADLGDPTNLEDEPLLPAVDYEWALALAEGKTDEDGEGRRIWGPAPPDWFRVALEIGEQLGVDLEPVERVVDELRRRATVQGAATA